MPHYHTLGIIPPKRHTQFRKPDGNCMLNSWYQQRVSLMLYSITYHLYPPTRVLAIDAPLM
jgi:homogentisate 1,2-dioxygenase